MNVLTEYAAESILLVFLIITFLQSGLDKLLEILGREILRGLAVISHRHRLRVWFPLYFSF